MFRSMSTTPDAGVFAVGKFAGYPEFLRAEAGGEAVDAFDEWVERGNVAAYERWGPQWSTTFPMGAAQGFLWSAAHDQTRLCGVIAPSRDAVGRDYPLAVAARFPGTLVARAPHIVPLAFGEFLDAAYRVIDEARTIPMSVGELTSRLQTLAAASVDDVHRAEAEYAAWCHSTPLERGWSAIFPCSNPMEKAARALHAIGAVLAPFRGREAPETSLVLRLPLGMGGVAAAALWCDVVRRICRWSSTVPSAFWGLDEGVLLLAIGRAPSSAFAELWRPDPASESTCDIANMDDRSIPSSGLREQARAFGDTPGQTPMAVFLDSLVR
jgi:type VI secretion system protein ImpM